MRLLEFSIDEFRAREAIGVARTMPFARANSQVKPSRCAQPTEPEQSRLAQNEARRTGGR
jgi:hypothetical protein